MKLSACIKSMRLRTLPLSEAGVLLGMFISIHEVEVGAGTVVFLVLTAALLQILSNLSNELGDSLHGTDTASRQGKHYSIMDGEMTVPEMKKLIGSVALSCCVSGLLMIYFSFGTFLAPAPIVLTILGAAAVWAAMKYTLGRNPYGYKGLGDLFVFIFFGLVSVYGAYFVCSHDLWNPSVILPACGIGFFSIGVLNVNNIRDMKTDIATRSTVAIKIGERGARIYQTVLIFLGWSSLACYAVITPRSWSGWLFLAALPLFTLHLSGVWKRRDRALDPMLPLLVFGTFIASVLMGIFV